MAHFSVVQSIGPDLFNSHVELIFKIILWINIIVTWNTTSATLKLKGTLCFNIIYQKNFSPVYSLCVCACLCHSTQTDNTFIKLLMDGAKSRILTVTVTLTLMSWLFVSRVVCCRWTECASFFFSNVFKCVPQDWIKLSNDFKYCTGPNNIWKVLVFTC